MSVAGRETRGQGGMSEVRTQLREVRRELQAAPFHTPVGGAQRTASCSLPHTCGRCAKNCNLLPSTHLWEVREELLADVHERPALRVSLGDEGAAWVHGVAVTAVEEPLHQGRGGV